MVVGPEQKELTEKKLLANIEQPCYYDAGTAEKIKSKEIIRCFLIQKTAEFLRITWLRIKP